MTSRTTDPTMSDPLWNPQQALDQEQMATEMVLAMRDAAVVPDGDMLTVTVTVSMRPEQLQAFYDLETYLCWDE